MSHAAQLEYYCFNAVIIKNGTIALRNGIDHRRILELVVEN